MLQLHGTVKFDGNDVPAGRIDFVSQDGGQTATGMGYATIHDGSYHTGKEGRGVAPGRYLARVAGFDGKPSGEPESSVYGAPLFELYTAEIDVQPSSTNVDFSIE